MDVSEVIGKIRKTESPLTRQLLMVSLITALLEEQGKPAPILIGGGALSYYTREVYFTADIDLAYGDREALDNVLQRLGFGKQGRYWTNVDLNMAVEVPTAALAGEDAPIEVVELGPGLQCRILGLEDLLIDRLNACNHWKSEIDCEMAELLVVRYAAQLDWDYLRKKAGRPENDTLAELEGLEKKAGHRE